MTTSKNIFIRSASAFLLMAVVALFSGCDDDEAVDDGKVELLSFGPSGVQHGESISFIGRNMNKVSAVVFHPSVEVPGSAFTSVSAEKITLTVPHEVESGLVVLKTPEGDLQSKTVFNLEVPVEITSVTGEAKPGTNITITGSKLNWVESITFPADLLVEKDAFVSQSATEIVVTVPMEAQTGFLTFNTGGTEPLTFNTEDALTVKLPVASSLAPASIRHAQNLTISGTDLDLVTKIDFPGGASVVNADFVSQSETSIVVTVPVTTTNGKLVMTVPSGLEVESDDDIVIILPVVTAFTPASTSDHTPGETLTITGTDLDLVASLTFPMVQTPVTTFGTHTPTEIEVVIPAGAVGGTVVITTIHGYLVPITVPFGDQLTLLTVIFDDQVHAPLGAGGGWGGVVTDAANTEKPRVGTTAVKVTFANSWGGGCQFGNWNGEAVSTAGASFYAFSIYGDAGTDGKVINVNVAGSVVGVTIEEGKWKDVQIPLSDFNSPAGISEIWFQDQGWAGVVYIDQIGLK